MSRLRFSVVEKAFAAKPIEVKTPSERPDEYFAKHVFNREKMFKYLPTPVFNKLVDAMDNGAALDRATADQVAEGMKRWAMEQGGYSFLNSAISSGRTYCEMVVLAPMRSSPPDFSVSFFMSKSRF